MIDQKQINDPEYAMRAALYLEAGQSQNSRGNPWQRPKYVPSRVRLIRDLRGDYPIGHMLTVNAGEHNVTCNQWGAISIPVGKNSLGVRPEECVILEWTDNPKWK